MAGEADNKPDAEDEKLAGIFARGMEIYEERKAERDAKEAASKEGNKEHDSSADKPAGKSFRDRLLG